MNRLKRTAFLLLFLNIFISISGFDVFAYQKITASNAQINDRFGESVCISGEYAIVGAAASMNSNKPGSAHIYQFSGSWIQRAILNATDASNSDDFGLSVSISGDNAIVASRNSSYMFKNTGGSWGSGVKLIRSGTERNGGVAVSGDYAIGDGFYVFYYDGLDWIEQQKLVPNGGMPSGFGYSAGIEGEYAVISSPWEGGTGYAYIFKRTGAIWTQQARISASDGASGDNFGFSVSISGDDVIIGAFGNSAAYIFRDTGSTWSQVAKLTASDAGASDLFGWTVSISGGYAVVGDYRKNSYVGQTYVFEKPGGGWTNMTETTRLSVAGSGEFGESVSTDGKKLIVGAITDGQMGAAAGAAFIYDLSLLNLTVSGYVRDNANSPISGVPILFTNGGGDARTDSNGFYSHKVVNGWSGDVSASQTGYAFTNVTITSISSNRPNTNLTGKPKRTGLSVSPIVQRTDWSTSYSNQRKEPCKWYEKCEGDPVDTSTGAQVLKQDYLSVQGVIPVTFSLAYNSLVLDVGSAGVGWDHNFGFNASLEELGSGNVLVRWSKSRTNKFVPVGGGVYTSEELACRYDELVKNGDGTWTLTRQERSVYQFGTGGRLVTLLNEKGQAIQFAYNTDVKISRITEPVSGVYLDYAYNANGLLASVSDPLGRQVLLGYDGNKHLTTIADPDGHTTTYTYNSLGQTLSAVNDEGHRLFANTYDAEGRIATQDDGVGTNSLLRFSYDEDSESGKIKTTVTDRIGNIRTYVYDSEYLMLEKIDELGNSSAAYAYDAKGNRTGVTDANGHGTMFGYDAAGNTISVTDAAGNQTVMTYDSRKNLLSARTPLSQTTNFQYDANDNLIRTADPQGNATVYTYNANGQVTTIQSPGGNITTFQYANGRVSRITKPEGNFTTFAYDAAGRLTSYAVNGTDTYTIAYDNACPGACRTESVTNPLGHQVSMTHDSRGNLLTLTDARGYVTNYAYDANGNLVRMTDALNNVTQYEYDGEDRLARIIDARGNSTRYEYDAKGRLFRVTDALNHTSEYAYDNTRNVTAIKDALQNTAIANTYDVLDNLKTVADLLGNTTTFNYNALSLVTGDTDPLSRGTQYQYDTLNRLVAAIDAMGGQSSQQFDTDGNLIRVTDPNGNNTNFGHDGNGRPVTETSAAGNIKRYAHNAKDLLSRFTNGRGQNRDFTYDAAGRITQVSDPDGTIIYTYDENGNVLTVSDASGTISRQYDALNRVTRYTDSRGNVIQYAFDAVGNLTVLTYPDGKQVRYAYDACNRLASVSDWANRITQYEYDANHRLTRETRPNGTVMTRTYNAAGQLTQIRDVKSTGELIVQYDFSYDAAGNITEELVTPTPEPVPVAPAVMTYASGNRLATYNGETVTHDADGNMTRGPLGNGMADFQFDSRNRLVRAGTTVYSYDAEDHRFGVAESGVQTSYVVNPEAALSQTLVRRETDGTNTFYVYGLGLIGQERNGAYLAYHYDLRGSSIAHTDESGSIEDRFLYAPYGALLGHTGISNTPFLYNGRDGVIYDENHLINMRARYYNPQIKRFLNQDILLGKIDNSCSLNRYSYVQGDPITYIDPLGLLQYDSSGYLKYDDISFGTMSHPSSTSRFNFAYYSNLYTESGRKIEARKLIFGKKGLKTNCHGTTFAEGEFWINDNQVDKILADEYYPAIGIPRYGDVVIYRNSGSARKLGTDIVHSATVRRTYPYIQVEDLAGMDTQTRELPIDQAWSGYTSYSYYRKKATQNYQSVRRWSPVTYNNNTRSYYQPYRSIYW